MDDKPKIEPRKPRVPVDPEAILRDFEGLVRSRDQHAAAPLLFEMVESVMKCLRDDTGLGDLKVLNQVLKEMRYAFKVFAPYRRIRKVSIFGSARTPPDAPEYAQARAFANRITRMGWMVITGAGGGVMEAAQGGAGRTRSFGVNIRLPFEQKANTFIDQDSKLINFKYFFTRKLMFVKETDAIALFPGGFGTHDEGFESLTLVQTGKSNLLPIVFIDRPGGTYWREWKKYVEDHLSARGYIDPSDLSLFTVTDDVESAARTIESFYRNYHSSRFVSARLVIRLQNPVSDAVLESLNDGFGNIVKEGRIERCEALPGEENEPDTLHLHRICLWFDRRNVGRLRKMVDVLNEPA